MISDQEIDALLDDVASWIYNPLNCMPLSAEEKEWFKNEGMSLSSAYIGMLRVYKNNNTIWQTSVWAPIYKAIYKEKNKYGGTDLVDKDSLREQFKQFFTKLRNLSEEDREKVYSNRIGLLND